MSNPQRNLSATLRRYPQAVRSGGGILCRLTMPTQRCAFFSLVQSVGGIHHVTIRRPARVAYRRPVRPNHWRAGLHARALSALAANHTACEAGHARILRIRRLLPRIGFPSMGKGGPMIDNHDIPADAYRPHYDRLVAVRDALARYRFGASVRQVASDVAADLGPCSKRTIQRALWALVRLGLASRQPPRRSGSEAVFSAVDIR